jgi:HK97 family phage portal protein
MYVDELNPVMPRYYLSGNEIPREDVVHIPWFVVPGKVVGLSPIAAFARSIGAGLSASQFSKDWFDNGGQPPGTFQNKNKTINQIEAEEIKNRLVSSIRSHKPIVYGNDWEYNVLRVTQEEAQFIQTQKLTATQMANIFGVPPEMVGGDTGGPLTYDNLMEEGERLSRFALRPWLVRLEQAVSQLLPERQFVKFNLDALVRADIKTRYEAYKIALEAGFMTLDEVRELEERPPLPKPPPVPQPVPQPELVSGNGDGSRVHYLPAAASDPR